MSVTDMSSGISKELSTDLVGNIVFDYGDHALMLQCGSTAEVLSWIDALRGAALPGVVDLVPAAPRLQGIPRRRLRKMRVGADAADAVAPGDRSADVVIDVVYDGPDLAEVANHTGLRTEQVIDAHTSTARRG